MSTLLALIPETTVSCPECASTLAMGDAITDTLTEQTRALMCTACTWQGEITLTLTWRQTHWAPTPANVVTPRHGIRAAA